MAGKWSNHTKILIVIVLLLSGFVLLMRAQVSAQEPEPPATETPLPADPPTAVPADTPTEPPTATPSPTETPVPTEPPTATPLPTDTSVPIDESTATPFPTEPVELTPTPDATEPQPADLPEFILPMTVLETDGSEPLLFEVLVRDDLGAVNVELNTTGTLGVVAMIVSGPPESEPPFTTSIALTYTAPPDATGQDVFVLTATNEAGLAASVTISVVLVSAPPVDTPTPELTPTQEPLSDKELIIKYDPQAPEEAIQAMLASINAVEVKRIPQIGAMLVQVPVAIAEPAAALSAVHAQAGHSAMLAAAGVTAIEENFDYVLYAAPNDPYYAQQWALTDVDSGIFLATAWTFAPQKGMGVVVAVLDSGVDLQHPDLTGQLVPGWDFVNDDNNPDDDHGHGTHVAGIIAAKANNGVGITGIAPNAKIMPVKVCEPFMGGTTCSAYDTMAGIVFATEKNARVINLSLGQCYGPSVSENAAIQFALSRGVVVVASAGNGIFSGGACASNPASYSYPASYPGVISVAAHDEGGATAGLPPGFGYNYNDRITLSAPGVAIMSTLPIDSYSPAYQPWDGTSMAAPQVSGVVALILGAKVATTPPTVREALICGAWDRGGAGYDNFYGWGILQADWSLNWRENSSDCQVSQPNDTIEFATKATATPFTKTQPVSQRSVTSHPTDPPICGVTRPQTLWYQFKPTKSAFFQITTVGSSYDTVLGVFQGSPGALNELACNDDLGMFVVASQLHVQLTANQTYYIAVGGFNGTAVEQIMSISISEGISQVDKLFEESAPSIAYSGTWATINSAKASGLKVRQTTDNSAMAAFSIRGTYLELLRTIGPGYGSLEVWVDGGLQTIINNRAAVDQAKQKVILPLGGYAGAWHRIVLRRSAGGPAGPVDIDAVIPRDYVDKPAISGTVNDTDVRLQYFGGPWYQVGMPGASGGTVHTTTDGSASVLFRAQGSAIIIYRNVAPTYGWMNVWVDGQFYATVWNDSGIGLKVPYVISGLAPTEHVVQVFNFGRLEFDGVKAFVAPKLPTGTKVEETHSGLLYSGLWTKKTVPTALMSSNDPDATVEFDFNGNIFCLGYQAYTDGGFINIYVDGALYDGINLVSPFSSLITWCSTGVFPSMLADIQHHVLLDVVSGSFDLNYVHALRYNTLTPLRGYVPETDPAYIYSTTYGPWNTEIGTKSPGGFVVKNGSVKYTTTYNGVYGGHVTFFINGTGFIFYTVVEPASIEWEVYVDGLYDRSIYLGDFRWKHPQAYGVTDLPPGIHRIDMRAIVTDGERAYFDGVRVFP